MVAMPARAIPGPDVAQPRDASPDDLIPTGWIDGALRSLRRTRVGGPIEYVAQAMGGLRRPELLRSGATPDEERRHLPGDELVPDPMWAATRAITIDAPAAEVWPWVEQLGYGRGGWYGWNPLERGDTGADSLLAGLAPLKVGDVLLDGPGCDETRGAWTVRTAEPPSTLSLYTLRDPTTGRELSPDSRPRHFIDCGWTFVLLPDGPTRTRLVVRTRVRFGPRWMAVPLTLNPVSLLGAGDTVMQRRLLEGIKARAEHPAPVGPAGRRRAVAVSGDGTGGSGPRSPLAPARRWLYRGGTPSQLARALNRAQAALNSAGVWPSRLATLEVPGRRSGRIISLPVVIAEYQGERYLVAMLGEKASWVRNIQAAGGRAVLRHGRREHILLEPVPVKERPPILRRYLESAAGARAHFPVDRRGPLSEFERIAPRTPVFRIVTPGTAAGGARAEHTLRADYNRGIALYNAGDLDRYADEYTEDAVLVTPNGTFKGRSAIREYWNRQRAAFPDLALTVDSSIVHGNTIVTEWTWTGANSGPLTLTDGTESAPTGKRVEVRGAEFAELTNHRISSYHMYWDRAAIFGQLGVTPRGPAPDHHQAD